MGLILMKQVSEATLLLVVSLLFFASPVIIQGVAKETSI
jgi:hypothetical protein